MPSTAVFHKERVISAFKKVSESLPSRLLSRFGGAGDFERQVQNYLRDGAWEKATGFIEAQLERDPDNTHLHTALAEAFWGKRDLEKAGQAFAKAVGIYTDRGQLDVAVVLLDRICRLLPNVLHVQEKRVELLIILSKEYAGERALNYRAEAIKGLHFLAQHIGKNELQPILPFLNKICELFPEDMDTLSMVVKALLMEGEPQQALTFLYGSARRLISNQHFVLAQKVVAEGLKIDEHSLSLRALDFLLEVYLGSPEVGLCGLESLHQESRQSVVVLRCLADAEIACNRPDRATRWLKAAYVLDPSQALVMLAQGREMLALGKLEVAYQLYSPLADDALLNDCPDKALDLMRALLRVDKGHLPTLNWLVKACLRCRFHNQAAYYFESLIRQAVRHDRLDECRVFIQSCFDEMQADICCEYLARIDEMVAAG